jgi:hypothetical protein
MGTVSRVLAIGVSLLATLSAVGESNQGEVPFELRNGFLIVVKGSIGDLRNLSFVVDTGSRRSVIDEGIARKLHLQSSGSVEQLAPGGIVEMRRAAIAGLSWGGKTLATWNALRFDLTPFSRYVGTRIDMILGLDVLCQTSFEIDYKALRIRFGSQLMPENSVSFEPNMPLLVVESRVDDRSLKLLVDTGCDSLAIYADRLPKQNASEWGEAKGHDISGMVRFKRFDAKQFQLGDRILCNVQGFMTPARPEAKGYDGSLAPTAIRAARIYFDFERMRFGWDGD